MNAPQSQAAAKTAKPKVNLTSVTPAVPPPEPEAMDTTTPMDVSVVAFTALHLPKWGPWLLARLQVLWPYLQPFNYVGVLTQRMNDRGTIFLRSSKAIIMATVAREALEPRPVCDIVFCFKHHPDDETQNKDVRLLFRRVEDWARSQGVRYVRVLYPERLDTTYSRTKEVLWGHEEKVLVKDLDA